MPDAISPDDIEKTTFSISANGYDKDEVDVFLKSVAEDVRSLIRRLDNEELARERPYHALGREVADILEHANNAALRVKKMADTEAANILQEAHRSARRDREEAQQLRRRAESEASIVSDEAHAAAERITEEAAKARRLAEAEAQILQQEVRRSVKKLKDEAREYAAKVRATSEFDANERTRDSERRLRRLQEAEVILRGRIESLKAKLESVTAEVGQQSPQETDETTINDDSEAIRITDDSFVEDEEIESPDSQNVIRIDATSDGPVSRNL
jgi:DivIVA domain-containing protein